MRIFERSRVDAYGYILAGGVSSRFGRDKALVELGGIPMIERMHKVLQRTCVPQIWIVGDQKKYSNFGPCIADRQPGQGPLGGILTCLLHSSEYQRPREAVFDYQKDARPSRSFIVGCDMPFLNGDFMEEFLLRSLDCQAQVVVPRSEHGLEPLCACWQTSALPELQKIFDQGVRKVSEAMKRLRMEVLDETHWKRFDTTGRLFWNMNTQQDYEEAMRILGTGQ